jgi:hypothetical protein
MNEREYLKQQAKLAHQKMNDAASRLGGNLATGANPLQWTRDYPWPALGIAALAGAAIAAVLHPKGEKRPRRPARDWFPKRPEKTNGKKESIAEKLEPKINYLKSLFVTEAMSILGHLLGQLLTSFQTKFSEKISRPNPQPPPSPDSADASA